ncbi:glycosyltransferase [Aurantiacibacter odishensis]|uniref:glycosyltransferase n=1 Tax=Aurantiacibacter odishensis TaxID=1155476 RepID=UPI0013C50327|nr:glycosyltransferase [Aurantiacibacter odishensis]
MHIAVIAHNRHAVAEPFMGGMEAHTHLLCRALRAAGHAATLLAARGSDDACLTPICPAPYEAELPWDIYRGTPELEAFQTRAYAAAFEIVRAGQFDVVHNNSLFPALIDWARKDGIPMVTTQHVPPFAKMAEAVRRAENDDLAQITLVSESQLPLWFAQRPSNASVVYNGIDCRIWHPGEKRSNRLVWTGRITPNKGLLEAVEAVRRAGAALDIAGQVEDREYLAACKAAAGNADIRFLGQLHGEELRALVRSAKAALVTPMWDEPFGLVAAEALASGVPVIAFDRGAMREVVGTCGAVVNAGSVVALAEAVSHADTFDRAACRQRAVSHFSAEAMVAGYEQVYCAAIAAARAGSATSASSRSSTAALLA